MKSKTLIPLALAAGAAYLLLRKKSGGVSGLGFSQQAYQQCVGSGGLWDSFADACAGSGVAPTANSWQQYLIDLQKLQSQYNYTNPSSGWYRCGGGWCPPNFTQPYYQPPGAQQYNPYYGQQVYNGQVPEVETINW